MDRANPTMKIAQVDTKGRVVLPGAEPGDVFDVQRDGEERYVLVRLHPDARPAQPAERSGGFCGGDSQPCAVG